MARADRDGPQAARIGDGDAGDEPDAAPDRPFKRPFDARLSLDRVPSLRDGTAAGQAAAAKAPEPAVDTVDAAVPALKLPDFIDVVFGEMLKLPYATGPKVAKRADVIQLRSSGRLAAADFLSMVSTALKEYGVRVAPADGLYQIIEEESARARRPRFIRSRAHASTPADLRPVVQFVQLDAIRALDMQQLLQQAFPDRDTLAVRTDPRSGSIVLNGLPEDVAAAVQIINSMDRLQFSESMLVAFAPTFWEAEDLGRQLKDVLESEGWQVSFGQNSFYPIHIVPISFSNEILVFAKKEKAIERISYWLSYLDKPKQEGDVQQIFVYDVENTDAAILADTANAVLSGGRSAGGAADRTSQSGTNTASRTDNGGAIVVDKQGNRLIFSGSPSDYQRVLPLLRRLDTPIPEVLIEVTVAEITLTDQTEFGVDWLAENIGGNDVDFNIGTAEGLELPGGGLSAALVTGDVRAALGAFASNEQINVLSTPRLVARSGGSASIQVGSDIPVITSQQASDVQGEGGQTDILQQVNFRSTGVLLDIEPIVYGRNRVDLTVTQEVSSSLGASGAIASPTISNRNLTTQLTLEDGGTAVLGGLIQDDITVNNSGVPFLKDIPGLGKLFSVETLESNKTELLVIITAYIIRNAEDKQRFVDYLTEDINRALANPFKLKTRLSDDPL
ncbi:secretin N-terminal domain-containing protein [Rhodothalassium salexigens]|uniref:secretin N-terminal domain-containing protein n=1 Tax=Rhodothalassium salexigens TaxID=1086 RepID=UPI0010478F62|nr:secretin N-terminal domain-containing protein [Rhodothalassium salexigens]MBB4212086.1 general secretion pathway protein D [Rhodothalassium salexigens DSM 2132]